MDCKQVEELLPWFLNDSLEKAEHEKVKEHLGDCSECRGEIEATTFAARVFDEHVEVDSLLDYALDQEISSEESSRIESHLQNCAACRDQVEMARNSRRLQQDEIATISTSLKPAASPGLRIVAIAASLAVAILAGWLFLAWNQIHRLRDQNSQMTTANRRLSAQERSLQGELAAATGERDRLALLDRPSFETRAFDLFPREMLLRSGAAPRNRLRIGDQPQWLTLILNSQHVRRSEPLEMSIEDSDGKVIWTGKGLRRNPGGDYTVNLPGDFLSAGRYSIKILDGSGKTIESYLIELEAKVQ